MKKIFILTNGCIRRSFDTKRLINYFNLNGCDVVKKPKEADYIIFISCSVKKNREEESFKLIKKFSKYRGEVIVGGCLPRIAPKKFEENFKGKFFTNKDIDKIDSFFKDFKIKFSSVPDDSIFEISAPIKDPLKKRLVKRINTSINFIKQGKKTEQKEQQTHAYMHIGYGCTGNCSYCSVKKALEPFRSKSLDECVEEYKKLINQGYRSFTIMSPDTGSYGIDIGSSLPELLDKFSMVDAGLNIKWYIIDLKPFWAIKYKKQIVDKLKQGKICHLLIPIQSGSNRILKLMNRYIDKEDMAKTILEFRDANLNLELRTHVIVGFPTETEEDFNETLDFIKRIRFNHVDLLLYYDAEGTASSKLDNKVSLDVAKLRLRYARNFLKEEQINFDCDDI